MSRKNSSVATELVSQDPDLESMSQQELLNVVKRCCSTSEALARPDFSTLRQAVKNLSE